MATITVTYNDGTEHTATFEYPLPSGGKRRRPTTFEDVATANGGHMIGAISTFRADDGTLLERLIYTKFWNQRLFISLARFHDYLPRPDEDPSSYTRYFITQYHKEFSYYDSKSRVRLVPELVPYCTVDNNPDSESFVAVFATEEVASKALSAFRAEIYDNCYNGNIEVTEYFAEPLLMRCEDGVPEVYSNDCNGADCCAWPQEIEIGGYDYRWSAADHEYIAVPDPDDGEDEGEDDGAAE